MNFDEEVDSILERRWRPLSTAALKEPYMVHPGVYLISCSEKMRQDTPLMLTEVDYVGMSVSAGGLRQRLVQFLRATTGKPGHSGGLRLHGLTSVQPLPTAAAPLMFVCKAYPAEVRKTARNAVDLRTMGYVACLEYFLLAHIRAHRGDEPRLNQK
jgi:hypothetical protein